MRNKKVCWSKQEDQKLTDHGEPHWASLPKAAGLERCGKSCRVRWIKYLRLRAEKRKFGADEEDLIIKLHALLGNRWSLIAGRLPGRTDKEVENYWNSHIKLKQLPNNHCLTQKPSPTSSAIHLKDADAESSLSTTSADSVTSPLVPIPFRPTSSFFSMH